MGENLDPWVSACKGQVCALEIRTKSLFCFSSLLQGSGGRQRCSSYHAEPVAIVSQNSFVLVLMGHRTSNDSSLTTHTPLIKRVEVHPLN